MRSQITRVKQSIVLPGLALALVVSGATPLVGDMGRRPLRRTRRPTRQGT